MPLQHLIFFSACSEVELIEVNIREMASLLSPDLSQRMFNALGTVRDAIYNYFMEISFNRSISNADKRYRILKEQFPDIDRLVSSKDIASYLRIIPSHLSRIRRN